VTVPEMKIASAVVMCLQVSRESGSVEPGVVAIQQGAADTPILRIGVRHGERRMVVRVERTRCVLRRGKLTCAVVRRPGHFAGPPPGLERRGDHRSRCDGGSHEAGGAFRAG
jgi:hypothetical protein